MKVGCRGDLLYFGQGWLMGLKLQGQGINMMLLEHKWSAVRYHKHISSSRQTGLIGDFPGGD